MIIRVTDEQGSSFYDGIDRAFHGPKQFSFVLPTPDGDKPIQCPGTHVTIWSSGGVVLLDAQIPKEERTDAEDVARGAAAPDRPGVRPGAKRRRR